MVKYEGLFSESKKDGIGYLHFNNGDIFMGEFKKDFATGYGVYYKKSGDKVCGLWERNKLKKILS